MCRDERLPSGFEIGEGRSKCVRRVWPRTKGADQLAAARPRHPASTGVGPAGTLVQNETVRAYAVWLLSSKVLKDDRDALTLIEEMRRLSALFDRQHKETARVCREVTAEAQRA